MSGTASPRGHPCPLCGEVTEAFHVDGKREFRRCPECALISVPPHQRLAPHAEKAIYAQHENDPADAGYRHFLSRAWQAVRDRVSPPATGLDFGSGPGPTLSLMLAESGYAMAIYDKFYAPAASALDAHYDFITATEVFEHLDAPASTLAQLLACLRPGGWLVIMTKRARDREAFARWHYIRDPTHVAFFSDETFAWMAAQWDLRLEVVGRDVVALRKTCQREPYADEHV